MNKIASAFARGKAFIPFFTCGDPDLETTGRLVRTAVENGADLVELGIPFSDPTAEGPVIQGANARALAGGITTDRIFQFVRELREDVTVPLVFMTYANVVFSYGAERFLSTCRDIGIDGLILPDLPFEEKQEFAPACREHGVALISLIAPTSYAQARVRNEAASQHAGRAASEGDESPRSMQRIAMIAKEAEGFLYLVSSLGVTGVRSEITTDLASIVKEIRKYTDIPCAIGFGISTPKQAREMAAVADGVIVGSALVRMVADRGRDAVEAVGQRVKEMKAAL